METKDYTQEIIDIIRSNTSPAVMSSRLEDYHANDLAEVLKKLTVQERCKLYRILDKDMLSDILEYTEADEAAEYLKEMNRARLRRSFPEWRQTRWQKCCACSIKAKSVC